MSKNTEVAAFLDEFADILELKEVKFKPEAYRRAAQQVRVFPDDIGDVARDERLHEIPGVGASIAAKIAEYVEKGEVKELTKLRKEVPGGLAELMDLPGLGPKRVALLNKELGIKDAASLKKAAEEKKIEKIDGLGAKTQQEILDGLSRQRDKPERFPQGRGLQVASRFIRLIEKTGKADSVGYAGSLRRGRDTLGDLDLLVAAGESDAEAIMTAFVSASEVEDVIAHGQKKSSVRLSDGLQVDLRVVTPDQYGAARLYFTGSKAHNVALRKRANGYGWTLNEYGLMRKKDDKVIAGRTEEEIYKKLKFEWIPPEIREDQGEIDAAKKGKLPRLLERSDVIADLHTHTNYSDGRDSPRKMLEAAQASGLKVYGFSDHSYTLRLSKGEDAKIRKQAKELDKLREEFPDMTILLGSEVNIKKDGSLDSPKKILAGLDYVIGSVHNAFDLPEKEQTRRVLKAIDEGIDIFGHPSGRKMPKREPIRFDDRKVFEACAEQGVLLEVDGQPERLDLPGERVLKAKQAGCRFVVDSDAHSTEALEFMGHAVTQARRGWLEKEDVVSTWTAKQIQGALGRMKKE